MQRQKYDILIIGGGAAGFTAGIYTARQKLRTLIVSKDIGGQAALTCEIENYPGVGLVEGPSLLEKFKAEAEKFGAAFEQGEAIAITKTSDGFEVTTTNGAVHAEVVILAFGLTPRNLGIPGEEAFWQRGISYCASLDAHKYHGQDVAVVGGGNSALLAADILAPIAQTVYLVHRRGQYRGEEIVLERIRQHKNIVEVLHSVPREIKGTANTITGLVVADVNDESKLQELAVSGIFVNIGYLTKTDWVGDLVEFAAQGHIKTDKQGATKTPGLFAAGDVTDVHFKQIVISAGEGAKAALAAWEYLKDKRGVTGGFIDWGKVGK